MNGTKALIRVLDAIGENVELLDFRYVRDCVFAFIPPSASYFSMFPSAAGEQTREEGSAFLI
jgi:hypothetical protein